MTTKNRQQALAFAVLTGLAVIGIAAAHHNDKLEREVISKALNLAKLQGKTEAMTEANAQLEEALRPALGNDVFEFVLEDKRYRVRGHADRWNTNADTFIESVMIAGGPAILQPGSGLWDSTNGGPLFIGRIESVTPAGAH